VFIVAKGIGKTQEAGSMSGFFAKANAA